MIHNYSGSGVSDTVDPGYQIQWIRGIRYGGSGVSDTVDPGYQISPCVEQYVIWLWRCNLISEVSRLASVK